MASDFVTGLDIGTSFIKIAIAENRKGKPLLRAAFREPSLGFKKGAIDELPEASQALNKAITQVKKISKAAARNIYINIGTPQIRVQPSRGIVAVSRADTEIYADDVDKVVKASQALNLAPNRTIIHTITREFIIDGVGDILDPIGLSGHRLEANSLIVDAFTPHVKNLLRVMEVAGGDVAGLVLSPLAASRSVLSKAQKNLGTVLIDIGAGTTGMSVYEENKLICLAKFPFGSFNVSRDLAVGLKIPVEDAEKLKLSLGYALASDVPAKESIDIKKFSPDGRGMVSRRFISEIIEVRLAEILDFVNNELKLLGKSGQLPGGIVFVGGGAKIPGLTDLGRQELKLTSQVGIPLEDEWEISNENLRESLEDPEFAGALGLALWGADEKNWRKSGSSRLSMKNLIQYFMP